MKICDVVLNSIWHDPRVRKQISEYNKYGVDLTCVGMKDKRYDPARITDLPCSTVLTERDGLFGGKQKSIIKKLLRELYRIRSVTDAIVNQCPDIIHANDLDALIPSYLAKRKLKCKLVFDAHEINCDNRYYDKYRLYARIMRAVERHIVKHCDLMVCVSNAAAEYYAGEYKINKPLVVTNCVSQEEIVPDTVDKHPGFEVLNHGMYRDSRGFELMVESCGFLEEYPGIVLAARGLGPLESALRESADKQTVKNFVFYPPADPVDMISEAAESHVGVAVTLPVCLNFELSVSNRLFEYAAAGLPVIMSDIPEHRYLNDKYGFGIVIQDNTPEEFTKAVIRLYEDKELYDRCKANAQRLSREINWEKEFSKLIEMERSWMNA
ncbi:MAG: glycosyltransferase family 4 protein [Ruminococcaceae bacterium]|nr:glycosyltransferase family 4 protein [Oscillospiraceae bacterium]